MALFALKLDRCIYSAKFYEDTKERIKNNDVLKNPFNAKMKRIFTEGNKEIVIVSIKPVYFDVSIFGFIGAASIFFFFGFNIFFFIFLIIAALHIFYMKEFYSLMYRIGLKKTGYNGAIEKISIEDVFNTIYF